jgi:hypothetical protein
MQELRANTQVKVKIGPAVAVANGYVPVTTLDLSTADEAELFKHDAAAVTDISGATFAAITSADGYYNLTLTTSHTDTEGLLDVVINDDSLMLPIKASFMVLSEAAYDSKYVAKDDGFMDVNIKTVGRADTQETEATNLEAACAAYSATRGLSGTALPAAAADAAGGLVISDAGGFDVDNRAMAAAAVTNANTVFNTDFAANYNTTLDAWNVNTTAISGDTAAADYLEALSDGAITGTADSGTTTTMVDTERTEAASYWPVGSVITWTSGSNVGLKSCVTAWDAGTDTLTFVPALPNTVAAGHQYEIDGQARVDVHFLAGQVVTAAAGVTFPATIPSAAQINTEVDTAITDAALATAASLAAVSALRPARPTRGVQLDDVMFMMVDATDLNTSETGVTVTATISKDGGAFAACTNAVSEVSNGFYKITLTATEMTANSVALKFTGTGCAQRNIVIRPQPT